MPWVAAASIFLNIFLLGSVDKASYIRFLIWTIIAVVFYLLYGVHSTHDAECRNLFEIPLKEGIKYEFFARYPEQVMVKDNILANNDEDSRPVQIKVQIGFSTPGCVDSQMPQDLYEKPLPTHGDIALLVVGAPEKGKRWQCRSLFDKCETHFWSTPRVCTNATWLWQLVLASSASIQHSPAKVLIASFFERCATSTVVASSETSWAGGVSHCRISNVKKNPWAGSLEPLILTVCCKIDENVYLHKSTRISSSLEFLVPNFVGSITTSRQYLYPFCNSCSGQEMHRIGEVKGK